MAEVLPASRSGHDGGLVAFAFTVGYHSGMPVRNNRSWASSANFPEITMANAAISCVICSILLAGCAGVGATHSSVLSDAGKDAHGAIHSENLNPLPAAMLARLKSGGPRALVKHPTQKAGSEAHHRLPRGLSSEPIPETPPEFPMEPGKVPFEARSFNFFPFRLRRRRRKLGKTESG